MFYFCHVRLSLYQRSQPSCQRAALLCPHLQRQSVCHISPSSPEHTKKTNCQCVCIVREQLYNLSYLMSLLLKIKGWCLFQPDLPERSGLAAVWHGSWQVLRWWVFVQEGVGSAALPNYDWSPHLVMLLIPLWADNLQCYNPTSVISHKQDWFVFHLYIVAQ